MTIGDRIKYFREQTKLTQAELAKITGLHPVSIRKYESNKMQPQLLQIEKIAEVLNISPNAIIGLDNSNLRLETIGDFMGIFYMLLDTDLIKINGERDENELLKLDTIDLKILNPIILSELVKWEKMNEMRRRVIEGKDTTSEDVFNALLEKMNELKEKVTLETQRSPVLIDSKNGLKIKKNYEHE